MFSSVIGPTPGTEKGGLFSFHGSINVPVGHILSYLRGPEVLLIWGVFKVWKYFYIVRS